MRAICILLVYSTSKSVVSRPRFGCDSPARTGSAAQRQLKGSAGQVPGGKVAGGEGVAKG